MQPSDGQRLIHLSPVKFLIGCFLAALAIVIIGSIYFIPSWVIALEVLLTVISLFTFGSIRYRLNKNALTYGMSLVILATFWSSWEHGAAFPALLPVIRHYLFSLHGLDELIHADTMLFILGLTFFVATIAQTRLLESMSFMVLEKRRGDVVVTIALLAAAVSFASGILDGVSMIGLMIRTMIVILFLAKVKEADIIYAVMISTIVTTVCGMWLAYGEPPNLIMKSDLHPHLDNAFFLRYCLPVAVASYFIVLWNIRRRFAGKRIEIHNLDILDQHNADVRFLQASRHGEMLTPIEFIEDREDQLGEHFKPIIQRLYHGEPLGEAMVNEKVPFETRKELLGEFVWEDVAEDLDHYYSQSFGEETVKKDQSYRRIQNALEGVRIKRIRSQILGAIGFIPFVGLLIWHAINHNVPLFISSFSGFAVSWFAIAGIPKMRRLALREAAHEYKEYLFLIPLFLSITILQNTGFLDHLSHGLAQAIEKFGASHVAFFQFIGTTVLSAILDNNVVADFGGRALQGLQINLIHLFSLAQIAGYAVGGCWTHIGSAQSVVAYSFIKKEIDEHFTPFQWIKEMTPIIVEILIAAILLIYLQGVWLAPTK